MFVIALLEYFSNLKKSLRRWKIIVFILISLFMLLLDIVYEEEGGFNIMLLYITSWISIAIRPKVSKLNYLLPGDKKSRAGYLIASSVGSLIFLILWYGMIYSTNAFIARYSIWRVLHKLFCNDLIFIIMISSLSITNYLTNHTRIDTKNVTTKAQTKLTKKNVIRAISLILYSIILSGLILLPRYYLTGLLYLGTVLLSYILTIPLILLYVSEVKKFDTCYENIRKPVKFL